MLCKTNDNRNAWLIAFSLLLYRLAFQPCPLPARLASITMPKSPPGMQQQRHRSPAQACRGSILIPAGHSVHMPDAAVGMKRCRGTPHQLAVAPHCVKSCINWGWFWRHKQRLAVFVTLSAEVPQSVCAGVDSGILVHLHGRKSDDLSCAPATSSPRRSDQQEAPCMFSVMVSLSDEAIRGGNITFLSRKSKMVGTSVILKRSARC